MTIVITGGGTAGHIFPGLSIADELGSAYDDLQIYWIGSKAAAERQLIERRGITCYAINSGKLRRYFSLQNGIDIGNIILGIIQSYRILKRYPADVLISKGGFVSVPPVIAARLLHIPIVLHESDLTPGLANRICARFADRIFTAYDETQKHIKSRRGSLVTSGNPIRSEFLAKLSDSADNGLAGPQELWSFPTRRSNLPLLLVVGGSLGARQINELLLASLDELLEHCDIVHQTGGKGVFPQDKIGYIACNTFEQEYPSVVQAASIVVSRAGAGAVWEFAVMKKPMLLLPIPKAASRGDQIQNADFFAGQGAARVLDSENVTAIELKHAILQLLYDTQAQQELTEKASLLCRSDAAKFISSSIADLLGTGRVATDEI